MSEFLEFVQNENSHHVELPFVTNYVITEDSQLFWELYGSSVETLALRGSDFQSVEVLRNVIFEYCPNMEHLALEFFKVWESRTGVTEEPTDLVEHRFGENRKIKSLNLDTWNDWISEKYPCSWMELLSYFPALETLNVSADVPNLDGLFRSLASIREHDQEKLKLINIQACFDYGIPNSVFRALQDPELRLVSLVLGDLSVGVAIEVQEILRIHASSFKKLHLCIGREHVPMNSIPFFPTPSLGKLVNLQELDLRFHQMTIEFLKSTPNLRKLKLRCHRILNAAIEELEMEGVPTPKCKELEFWENPALLEADFVDDLRYMARWLPNVEKLKTSRLRNRGFAAVCEHWPNSVSLIVDRSYVNDCGITGLDVEDVTRVNGEGEIGTWRQITVPNANITSLKRLRSFHMTANSFQPELGVCSALYGILQLPLMRHLTIERRVNEQTEPQNPTLWKAVTDRWGI